MKTMLIATLGLIALAGFPAETLAQMYQYVDTSGNIQDIDAANADQAIMMAPNIAPRSGVIMVMDESNTPIPESMDVQL